MAIHFNILDGQEVASDHTFDSFNPATGQVIGQVPLCSTQEVHAALASARRAQKPWAALPDAERQTLLMKVADALHDSAETLAKWVTLEQGKPLGGVGPDQVPGSRFELWGCEAWTRVPASLPMSSEVVFEDELRRDELYRRPYGVIAAIAPWNWPLLIAIWQIIPSLRAGNTVVLKPSELTSICTLEMVRTIAKILPPGVINTVTGGAEVGHALVDTPAVDKILFTGSSATGACIAAAAARHVTPTTLELGGNDAAIVLDDADPQKIAMGLFWGAFINMGQTCAAIKRLYVPDGLHDAVVQALQGIAQTVKLGDGLQADTVVGPVQNHKQLSIVSSLVEDAVQQGGHLVCGGHRPNGAGNFFPITLVTGLHDGHRLVDEEQFGPVLPIIRYHDVQEAIASANRLDVGLGASVWGQDPERVRTVAEQLEAGTVWINQHGMIHPMVPFGGHKSSGWGVEFGTEGLKSVTQPQVLSFSKS